MYDYGFVGVMYASLLLTVLASIRYWLFRDRLRIPFPLMVVILAAISFSSGVIWLYTGGIPGMPYDKFRILLAVFMFVLSCTIITAPLAEHIFSYAIILAGETAVETTAFVVQTKLFHVNV